VRKIHARVKRQIWNLRQLSFTVVKKKRQWREFSSPVRNVLNEIVSLRCLWRVLFSGSDSVQSGRCVMTSYRTCLPPPSRSNILQLSVSNTWKVMWGKVGSSETSVGFYLNKWRHIPEYWHILTYLLTYLLNYLLTHSLTYTMQQSPSWEANRFAASQEIPHIL
jgi:hypothetical protein